MMGRAWRVLLVAALAGCGGGTPVKHATSSSSGSSSGGAGAGSTTAQVTSGSGSASGSSGTNCQPNDANVGQGNGALCCSHYVDANGFCAVPGQGASTSSTSTTGASSTTTGGSTSATTTSGAGSTTGAATTSGATTTSTSTTGSTGGGCYPDTLYVGVGNGSLCCSGYESGGYCAEPVSTTGGSTTGGSTTGTTTSSTTTSGGSTGGGGCSLACYQAQGFHCENGQCVLNGGDGQLQFTLQWDNTLQTNGRAAVDLDLHVVEPSGCEIYYSNNNRGGTSSCGAVGWLDLDSNAGCSDTSGNSGFGADTENVIYPPDGGAPHGTYQVIVDDWADDCDTGSNPFNWKLTIRNGSNDQIYTGQFSMGDSDGSGALAGASNTTGHKVFSFTY